MRLPGAISKHRREVTLYPSHRPIRLAGSPTPQRLQQPCVPAHGIRTGSPQLRRQVHDR